MNRSLRGSPSPALPTPLPKGTVACRNATSPDPARRIWSRANGSHETRVIAAAQATAAMKCQRSDPVSRSMAHRQTAVHAPAAK